MLPTPAIETRVSDEKIDWTQVGCYRTFNRIFLHDGKDICILDLKISKIFDLIDYGHLAYTYILKYCTLQLL